jgi:hypothetical protein
VLAEQQGSDGIARLKALPVKATADDVLQFLQVGCVGRGVAGQLMSRAAAVAAAEPIMQLQGDGQLRQLPPDCHAWHTLVPFRLLHACGPLPLPDQTRFFDTPPPPPPRPCRATASSPVVSMCSPLARTDTLRRPWWSLREPRRRCARW